MDEDEMRDLEEDLSSRYDDDYFAGFVDFEDRPPITSMRIVDRLESLTCKMSTNMVGELSHMGDVHSVPSGDDLKKHVRSSLCPCGPIPGPPPSHPQGNAANWCHSRITTVSKQYEKDNVAIQSGNVPVCYGMINNLQPKCRICEISGTCQWKNSASMTIRIWDERDDSDAERVKVYPSQSQIIERILALRLAKRNRTG